MSPIADPEVAETAEQPLSSGPYSVRDHNTMSSRLALSLRLVLYEVRKSHVGSVLGIAWAVVYPLLFLALYAFFFAALGVAPGGRADSEQQLLVLLSGLVPWFFFSHGIAAGLGGLLNHAQLVKQINFPVGVLPFVTVGPKVVDFFIGLALVVALAAVAGGLGWEVLLIIPTALLLLTFVIAISAVLAPAIVMLRDLRTIVGLALRAGLFLSPVLYLPSALPEGFELVAYINPMTYFIEMVRYASLGGSGIELLLPLGLEILIASSVTVAALLVAWSTRSAARNAADYL